MAISRIVCFMQPIPSDKIISSILKHDSKQTSYKIALVRAINDVALSYPELGSTTLSVAIPLRMLAEFWLAYYYPFMDPEDPIYQGARALRDGKQRSDMAFRAELTAFRALWQLHYGGASNPADGFYAINELRLSRNQTTYSATLISAYQRAVGAIVKTIEMPIRYAGPSGQEWTIFEKPRQLTEFAKPVSAVPGTYEKDVCLVIHRDLWDAFRNLSLWIEALCIHEWCLFSERVAQNHAGIERGFIYHLLTARPDNRRPLSWERNQVDILLLEGQEFLCPWTQARIRAGVPYDLDHILPIAIYPINELWNLVPADPHFNSHKKRDRLPSTDSMTKAAPILNATYGAYVVSPTLGQVLHDDVTLRFGIKPTEEFTRSTVLSVINFIQYIGEARNLAQF